MNKNQKLLQQQLWNNRRDIVILLALSLVISILSLTVPWFMQYFTDEVVMDGSWNKAGQVIGVFFTIILIRFLVDMLYEKLLASVIYEKITFSVRKKVEHVLIHMDCKYLYKKEHEIDEKNIETILLGDVDAFRNILVQTIKFFTEVLKLLVYIGILFFYSVPVGLLVCVRIPVYYLLSGWFDKPLSAQSEKNRTLQSQLIQKVKKIFVSLPAIKTFQIEEDVTKDINSQIVCYCENQKSISVMNAKYQELNTAINTVMNIIVLTLCGYAILHGAMTLGTMMLISNIQSRTTMPLFFFNNYYLQYKSCFPSISRLVRFLEIQTEEIPLMLPETLHFERLSIKNICYSYTKNNLALHNFSIEIEAGDKLILTGDNMTGKSTLLKVLAGLITADEGQIQIDGKSASRKELRNLATLFLQNQECYGYFEKEGSGGEVQMENLALMKQVESPIILLDEPDASINQSRLNIVYQYLESKATVIMVTHRNTSEILKNYPNARTVKI